MLSNMYTCLDVEEFLKHLMIFKIMQGETDGWLAEMLKLLFVNYILFFFFHSLVYVIFPPFLTPFPLYLLVHFYLIPIKTDFFFPFRFLLLGERMSTQGNFSFPLCGI